MDQSVLISQHLACAEEVAMASAVVALEPQRWMSMRDGDQGQYEMRIKVVWRQDEGP